MERRVRYRHRTRYEWRLIAEQDGKVAVLFGECPVRPAPLPAGKRVEFGVGSFEDEVRKAAERSFTVEFDDQGEPKDEWARR